MVIAFSQTGFKFSAYSVPSLRCRHTSIVVHKDEFFFGSGGISSCPPVSVFPYTLSCSLGFQGVSRDRNFAAALYDLASSPGYLGLCVVPHNYLRLSSRKPQTLQSIALLSAPMALVGPSVSHRASCGEMSYP